MATLASTLVQEVEGDFLSASSLLRLEGVTDPTQASSRHPYLSLPDEAPMAQVVEVNGADHLTLRFRRSATAGDVSLMVEFSIDLIHWTAGVLLVSSEEGDGTVAQTWRSASPTTGRMFARVRTKTGFPHFDWEPEPFEFMAGSSRKFIDYENGDDANPGTRERPWKHHPWDPQATGSAASASGIHTYVFKRGVIYRGMLTADESGVAGNPIRLTSDPTWGSGEAVLAGSMRVDGTWTPYSESDGMPFPEETRDRIWAIDLDIDFTPRLAWLVDKALPPPSQPSPKGRRSGGAITPIHVAREPDWEITNPNYPMEEWWIWTDDKSSGRIRFQSTREMAGTEGFSVGEKIWISDGDETPAEVEQNRANSSIVITDISSSYLTVSWDESDNLGGLNGKIITNGVVYRNAASNLQNQENILVDNVNLVEPDPDFYKDATVWTEQHSYAGYGHPTTVKSYSPANHSVSFSIWVDWIANQGRSPTTKCRYFLEDKPQFLDSPGEFYFHRGGGSPTLYLRLPGDQNPNDRQIEIARHPAMIDIANRRHIEISGLSFRFENIENWFVENYETAAVRINGNSSHIKVSHCAFEHVIKALLYYPLRDGDVGDFIELSNSTVRFTQQNAIALSHGCGTMWGFRLFPESEPQGHLKHVKILRNHIYDIGMRPALGEACHAVAVRGGELVEIAHNIVDRTYGSGIQAVNSRFSSPTNKLRNWVSPLNRILVHHNRVTNTLLRSNDWGGIASWGVGPSYVFSNISGNAVGHRGYSWLGNPSPAFGNSNFGEVYENNMAPAYYFDHSYKSFAFNNIGWGTNNDVDDRFYSSTGFMETISIQTHLFHNTFYNFAVGQSRTWRDGTGSRYLANAFLDIGYAYLWRGVGADELATVGYANNTFHGDVDYFALGNGLTKHPTKENWQNSLDSGTSTATLTSETGTILSDSYVVDAAAHDFRPVPGSPGIDGGVKVFVPWGLYKVAGEWPFFKNRANPASIFDEHLYANTEWRNTQQFLQIRRHDLTGFNVREDDYHPGLLEDWVDGALSFNGTDQYASISDASTKSSYTWTNDWGSGTIAGSQRVTLDAGTENFLIEIVFRTSANQTGGTLVSKGDEEGGYHLSIDDGGRAQLRLNFGSGRNYSATTLGTVNDDQWHHLIAEVDRAGRQARVYVDGRPAQIDQEGSLATSASLENQLDFTVGRLSGMSAVETQALIDFEELSSIESISINNSNNATTSVVSDTPRNGGMTALRVDVPAATQWFSIFIPAGLMTPEAQDSLDLSADHEISFWIKSDISSRANFQVHDTAGNASAFTFQLTGRGSWTRIVAPRSDFHVPAWSSGAVDWSSVERFGITPFGESSYTEKYVVVDEISVERVVTDNKTGFFHGSIDYLRLAKGTLEDAETTIEELYEWQFNGPFLKDFFGNAPTGAGRDVGALESE